ncbi:hypothetical protein [Maritalea porphyrae]|uniref:Uncharacterized protein n=1 Tax=Maritalea porphyrae TaxID=880732 RepID=A0ABQ5UUK2_9HYPH|nr:hypothetical protein [Maritalea porphyrae]GLQ18956.1 hypothetical protein GCM10007879_32050 [Maritalea porphyrae]
MAKPFEFVRDIFAAIMNSRSKAVEHDIDHIVEAEHHDFTKNHTL